MRQDTDQEAKSSGISRLVEGAVEKTRDRFDNLNDNLHKGVSCSMEAIFGPGRLNNSASKTDNLVEKGMRLSQEGDYRKSERFFEANLQLLKENQLDPALNPAFSQVALVQEKQGKLRQARENWQEAIHHMQERDREFPVLVLEKDQYAWDLANLARIERKEGDTDKSEQLLKDATSMYKDRQEKELYAKALERVATTEQVPEPQNDISYYLNVISIFADN